MKNKAKMTSFWTLFFLKNRPNNVVLVSDNKKERLHFALYNSSSEKKTMTPRRKKTKIKKMI